MGNITGMGTETAIFHVSDETKELNGICPVCKKMLVIGVDNRVEEIAESKGI